MADLKARLQSDLAAAIKARETTRMAALRMALAAITTEEVAGDEASEMSDDEGEKVLTGYLPEQLDDDELGRLVTEAVAEVTEQLGAAPGQRQMGQVMKAANARIAGRAEGGRVAAVVRSHLQN